MPLWHNLIRSNSYYFNQPQQAFIFPPIINNSLSLSYPSHNSTLFAFWVSHNFSGFHFLPLNLIEYQSKTKTLGGKKKKKKTMGEEEATKVEEKSEKHEQEETPKGVTEEKSVIPVSATDHKDSDSKPSPTDEKAIIPLPPPPASENKKPSGGSIDRDAELVKLEQEKKLALIKAWEDSEKTKAQNKSCKKLSAIDAWENSRKASLEAELKKIEEQLEKKKAEYAEKMKNKVADIHKVAEEKRAIVEAQKGEELLKAEESAAKYRATGHAPKKFLSCF